MLGRTAGASDPHHHPDPLLRAGQPGGLPPHRRPRHQRQRHNHQRPHGRRHHHRLHTDQKPSIRSGKGRNKSKSLFVSF